MIKALIFDFDYTLGDSTEGIVICANDALNQMGYAHREVEEIRKTIGLTLEESFRLLFPSAKEEEADQYATLFKKKADDVMVECTNLYPDTKDILLQLKEKGYQIAIVTTKYRYRIENILKKFDAEDLVDWIVGGNDVKVQKPSPEGLLKVLGELGRKKEEVLYVGDSFVDAKAAQNADVPFAAVLTGTTERAEFEKYPSVRICEDLAELYQYVTE